jgi:hypothetical protein
LALIGLVLWLNDALPQPLAARWKLSAWQPWLPASADMQGLWAGQSSHWAYRLPIFLVYIAFVGTTAFWPFPKNLGHVLALTAALLIGIQFWYADRGGVYILWYLPLLLLLIFRPNLSTCQPQAPGPDWLARLGRRCTLMARRCVRLLRPIGPRRPVSRLVS